MRIRDTTIEQRSSSSSSSGSCSWILFNKTNIFFNFRETLTCLCRYLCFHSSLTSLVYSLLLLLFSTLNRTFLFFVFVFHHQLLTHYFNWPFHDQPKFCRFIPSSYCYLCKTDTSVNMWLATCYSKNYQGTQISVQLGARRFAPRWYQCNKMWCWWDIKTVVAVVLEEEINFSCLFVEVLLGEKTIKIWRKW